VDNPFYFFFTVETAKSESITIHKGIQQRFLRTFNMEVTQDVLGQMAEHISRVLTTHPLLAGVEKYAWTASQPPSLTTYVSVPNPVACQHAPESLTLVSLS